MNPKVSKNAISRRKVLQLAAMGIAASSVPGVSEKADGASGQVQQSIGQFRRPLSVSLDQNIAETNAGKVRGYRRGPICVFKGIPYGANTAGANRFRPPRPAEPWTKVRSCLSFGPINPDAFDVLESGDPSPWGDEGAFLQYRGYEHTFQSEDCLRLNIWTPGLGSTNKRAVMVYMHGGGFSGGSGHDLQSYNGAALSEAQDVVVVTHNHRLNAFGFLNLAEIGGEQYKESANVGLLDIVAVLEWVKTNISQFGGDPNRVMIFGQSGGGGKVGCLMAMPAAKGLFHAAAVQSGSILRIAEQDKSAELARKFLAELGLASGDLAKLQTASTKEIMSAVHRTTAKLAASFDATRIFSFKTAIPGWGPTRDGKILPNHPFDPSAPEVSAAVPMIVGTNEHEFVSGLDNPDAVSFTEKELEDRVKAMLGNEAKRVVEAYKESYPTRSAFDIFAAIAASGVRSAAFTQAIRKNALKRARAYEYIYAWRTPVLGGRPGTSHSAEIPMVFNNALYCDHYTGGGPEAVDLARRMSGAWAALAKTGSPQHSDIPEWPPFEAESKKTMIFDDDCEVVTNPEGQGIKLIEELGAA